MSTLVKSDTVKGLKLGTCSNCRPPFSPSWPPNYKFTSTAQQKQQTTNWVLLCGQILALFRGCEYALPICRVVPPLTLPSQICPDASRLSEAALGVGLVWCSARPASVPSLAWASWTVSESLPLPTRWPQTGLTDCRLWVLDHQSWDIAPYWC